MDPRQAHLIYEFGEFRLDALRRVLSLRTDGQPLQVTGRVLDALVYFVERAGQLLDKRTLMEALWPDLVVEESNLTQTIHTLRRLLGERPDEHRFIVTVPGRGYRFVADVRATSVGEPRPVGIDTPRQADRAPPRRRLLAVAAVAVAALGALLLFLLWPREPPRTPSEIAGPSIAVLPFADMSPKGDQEHFSDGLSEEILNLLAQSRALRVIARTSSFSFKDQNADIAMIADKLHVTHVLEGSVRKSGERMRITAQLVDGATSEHVWSEVYDRDVRDVFDVQTDIAASVAEALQVTLTGSERQARGDTQSPEALERYLQGRYLFNRRGPSDVARAKTYFEQAVQIDPRYARAWVGLAGVYHVTRDARDRVPEDVMGKWREAIERAVALGPNLSEAHGRAAQYYWEIGDARTGDEHNRRAMEINPSEPLVLGALANMALLEGRLDDAITLFRRSVAVDPLSRVNRSNLGLYLRAAGQLEEAKVELEKAFELSPNAPELEAEVVKILVLQQRYGEALAMARQLPRGGDRDTCLALVYEATGNRTAADAALARLIAQAEKTDTNPIVMMYIAEVYTLRGSADEAFEWLMRADRKTQGEHTVIPRLWTRTELPLSPFLKPLHDDPRWQALVAGKEKA